MKLVLIGLIMTAAWANAAGVSYTCDPTVDAIDGSGVCAYLDTTVESLYNSTFTNANANIYITTMSSGLGESQQVTQSVAYSVYYNALAAESTDTTALHSLSSTEPATFGTSEVGLTAALVNALNIPGSSTDYGALYGVYENPANSSDPLNGTTCILSSSNCYNGVISVVTPAGLSAEDGQGLWFRDVAGTASGPQPGSSYDFFSVVQHETDELLGTASCSVVNPGPVAVDVCSHGEPSAVDLFRYSGPGTRVFNTLTAAYFSPDGGVTDTDGNTYNTTKSGEDYADFSQGCTFIQDAEGCPGQSIDITNDYNGGPGPEISILNAVGYDLTTTATPEPGTVLLFSSGLLGVFAYRRKRGA